MARFSVISSLILLKFLPCLVLATTVSSGCSNFQWIHTNHNPFIWSLTGEWRVIDCRVKNNEKINVTLWKNLQIQVHVDGKRIQTVDKNVFNISQLQRHDMGKYYCKACKKMKGPLRVNVKKGVPFATPKITVQPRTKTIKYESPVALECFVEGSLYDYEMIWYKKESNRLIKLPSRTTSTVSPNGEIKVQKEKLQITNFRKTDEGEYVCQINRYYVKYTKDAVVQLNLEELFRPLLSNFSRNLLTNEGKDLVFPFNFSGVPVPEITWYTSSNGKKERIAKCFGKTKMCTSSKKGIKANMHSLIIYNVTYLQHHNVSYICHAKNLEGQHEQAFKMLVKTKPRLAPLKAEIQLYRKGLRLNCSLSKDSNPSNLSFSWAFCDKTNDDTKKRCKEEVHWQTISSNGKNFIEVLKNQTFGIRLYRCIARNEMDRDKLTWTIVVPVGQNIPTDICDNIHAKLKSSPDKGGNSFNPIVIWQLIAAFLVVLLLLTLFLTYGRRNRRNQSDLINFAMDYQVETKTTGFKV